MYLLLAVEVTSLTRRRLPPEPLWRRIHVLSLPLFAPGHGALRRAPGTDTGNPFADPRASSSPPWRSTGLLVRRIRRSTSACPAPARPAVRAGPTPSRSSSGSRSPSDAGNLSQAPVRLSPRRCEPEGTVRCETCAGPQGGMVVVVPRHGEPARRLRGRPESGDGERLDRRHAGASDRTARSASAEYEVHGDREDRRAPTAGRAGHAPPSSTPQSSAPLARRAASTTTRSGTDYLLYRQEFLRTGVQVHDVDVSGRAS